MNHSAPHDHLGNPRLRDTANDSGLQGKVQNAPDIDMRFAKEGLKSSFRGVNAQLIQCSLFLETCSHHDLVHNSLKQWKKGYDLPTIDEDEVIVCESKELQWPLRAKLDMVAYTHLWSIIKVHMGWNY